MVKIVNRFIQLLSRFGIGIPCVVADLSKKIYTFGMYDDVIILNVINAIVYTVFAFAGFLDVG